MKLFTSQTEKQIEMALSGEIYTEDDDVQVQTKKILAEGQKLQEQRQQEVLAWTGEEIARQMREQIKNETGHHVTRVAVKLGTTADEKEPIISSVEVMMGEPIQSSDQAEPSEKGQQTIAIPAVKEVEINVNLESQDKPEHEVEPSSVAQLEDEEQKQLTNKVETFLQETWGLQKEVISVNIEQLKTNK